MHHNLNGMTNSPLKDNKFALIQTLKNHFKHNYVLIRYLFMNFNISKGMAKFVIFILTELQSATYVYILKLADKY